MRKIVMVLSKESQKLTILVKANGGNLILKTVRFRGSNSGVFAILKN